MNIELDHDQKTEIVREMLMEDLDICRDGGYDECEGLEEALIRVINIYTAGGFKG